MLRKIFEVGNDVSTATQTRGTMSIQSFNADIKDYALWKFNVIGYLTFKGLHTTIKMSYQEKMCPIDQELDINKPDDQAFIKYRNNNQMAVSCLTTAQTDPDLIMEIMRVIRENTDYPNGLACEVWKAIQDWMTPSDQYSRLDMLEDMQKIKLKTNQDPRQLGIAIEHFQSKYQDAPDPKDILAVVRGVIVISARSSTQVAQLTFR